MTNQLTATIRVKRLHADAQLPQRATSGATGFDIYAFLPQGAVALGQIPVSIPTGIAIETPEGVDVQTRPRSGLARRGIVAASGTIDSDYRGEIRVTMYTTSPEITHVVEHGDRIAQIVVGQTVPAQFTEVPELSATQRGDRGFGSTGR